MPIKKLELPLPLHLKKFLEYEYETRNGVIHVEKSSWLGHMIYLSSFHIPFTQPPVKITGTSVNIQYYNREKVRDVPNDKIQDLVKQIDEQFRFALRVYVSGLRYNLQCDYSPFIDQFLKLIDFNTDGLPEKDWEGIRKIYRDYEAKVAKKNQKRFA
jgi:hypothetical protein